MNLEIKSRYIIFLVAVLVVFFLQYPVAPSDPLQYLNLAVLPSGSVFFIDRLTVISLLNIFYSIIGGEYSVYYLSAWTTAISAIVAVKIVIKEQNGNFLSFFVILLFNYSVVSNFGYGYPTQIGFCLQISALYFVLYRNHSFLNALISCLLIVMLLFSKIQYIPSGLLIFSLYLLDMYKVKKIPQALVAMLLSLMLFFLTASYILDSDIIALANSYFSGEFSKQYEGRNAGGLPPFYILFFEPAFMMATIGVVGALLSSLSGKLKLLALVALVDLVFLVAIYVITGRGGPIIFNYFYSYYFIGSICFALLYLRNLDSSFLMTMICLFITTYFLSYFWGPLGFSYLSMGKYFVYKAWFVLLGIVFFGLFLLRDKFKLGSELLLVVLFLGPGVSSIFELNFKRSFSWSYMSAFEKVTQDPDFCFSNSEDKYLIRYTTSHFLSRYKAVSNRTIFCDADGERQSLSVVRSNLKGFYVKGL